MSRLVSRSWSIHVSARDAANAIATAPTRRTASLRCVAPFICASFSSPSMI